MNAIVILMMKTYTCSAVSTTGASDIGGCDNPGTFPPNLNKRSIFNVFTYFINIENLLSNKD